MKMFCSKTAGLLIHLKAYLKETDHSYETFTNPIDPRISKLYRHKKGVTFTSLETLDTVESSWWVLPIEFSAVCSCQAAC